MKAIIRCPSLACAAALFASALLLAPGSSFAFTAGTSLRSAAATNNNHRRNLMMFSGGGSGDDVDEEGQAKEKVPLGTYNPLRLAVLKLGFTELRWTSPLNYEKRDGQYKCANCGTLLFTAEASTIQGVGGPASSERPRARFPCTASGTGGSNAAVASARVTWDMCFRTGQDEWMWWTMPVFWMAFPHQICRWATQTRLVLVCHDIA